MDDARDVVCAICLGVLALGALVIMGLAEERGHPVPPAVAAAFGTCVGSLATTILSRKNGDGGHK